MYDKVAKHNKNAVRAAKQYAKAKPWEGTFAERVEKLRMFHADLNDAYDLDVGLIVDSEGFSPPEEASGFMTYDARSGEVIVLCPAFAVMTYLRLFAEALERNRGTHDYFGFALAAVGIDEYSARWANGLFSKAFPKSWDKLVARNAPILTRSYA
jgi:hypothetical protein